MKKKRIAGACAAVFAGLFLSAAVAAPAVAQKEAPPVSDGGAGGGDTNDGYSGNIDNEPGAAQP